MPVVAKAAGHRNLFLRQQELDRFSGVASDAAAANGHVARDRARLVAGVPLRQRRVGQEVVAGVGNQSPVSQARTEVRSQAVGGQVGVAFRPRRVRWTCLHLEEVE